MSYLGTRVLRGPDWDQNEADGGEGHLGTVVGVKVEEGTAEVVWDKGQATRCRVGKEGKHDLRVLDNAQAGVRQASYVCKGCGKTVLGMRWRCTLCVNLDLCSLCYAMGVHDLSHTFDRFITSDAKGIPVGSRLNSSKVRLVGIFPGARVARGPDWLAANADGGAGGQGTVVEVLSPESGSARNAVRVSWDSGQSLQHRLGLHGKVDLLLVKESPASVYTYLEHLPVMEAEHSSEGSELVQIQVGDNARVEIDEETFKAVQKKRSGWCVGMRKCIGKTGLVTAVAPNGDLEVEFEGQKWRINPIALRKGKAKDVPVSVGDKVRVLDSLQRVKDLQKGHGGWNEKMRHCLGKVGRVKRIDGDGDYRVSFGTEVWTFHHLCCRPAPDGELEHPDVETDDPRGEMGERLEELAGLFGGGGPLRIKVRRRGASKVFTEADQPPSAVKLGKAILTGDVGKVAALLDKEPELVRQGVKAGFPLHVAAEAGEAGVAALLLDRGSDINQGDKDEDTPLILAVGKNRQSVVQLLLDRGADVNLANEDGRTALHKATHRGRCDMCRLLLRHGASVNRRDVRGHTALFSLMEDGDEAEIIEILLTSPEVELHAKNRMGFNLLHFAAFHGRSRCMAKLLSRDETLVNDSTQMQRWTPLHVAAVNDRVQELRLLIQAGGDVNRRNSNNLTPLHLAGQKTNIDIAMILVENGANLNAQDDNRFTPLHFVMDKQVSHRDEESRVQAANYLIQQGARTDLRQKAGKTPLEVATENVRARVEAFMRENEQPRAGPKVTPVNSSTVMDSQQVGSGERGKGDKKTNESTASQTKQTVMAASKCTKCSTSDVNAIFLPCAHKLLCHGCAVSVSVCPQCHKPVKQLIDLHGNTILK